MSTKRNHSNRGFTLVELIVSMALFITVITIVSSAYISLISLNRRARATNDLVSNLSYVVEAMSRSIRTGTNYQCGGVGIGTNCTGGNTAFGFTNDQGQNVTYLLKPGGIIGECIGTCTTSSASPLTDARINVTNLKFYVQGVGTGDQMQPRVLFTMSGTIIPEANAAPITFTIESSATERLLEL